MRRPAQFLLFSLALALGGCGLGFGTDLPSSREEGGSPSLGGDGDRGGDGDTFLGDGDLDLDPPSTCQPPLGGAGGEGPEASGGFPGDGAASGGASGGNDTATGATSSGGATDVICPELVR